MPSRKAIVTQAEITRYAKGLCAAGLSDFRLDFVVTPDGMIRHSVTVGMGAEAAVEDADDIDTMIERIPDATS